MNVAASIRRRPALGGALGPTREDMRRRLRLVVLRFGTGSFSLLCCLWCIFDALVASRHGLLVSAVLPCCMLLEITRKQRDASTGRAISCSSTSESFYGVLVWLLEHCNS